MYAVSPSSAALCTTLDLRLDVGLVHGARNRTQLSLGELVRERREITLLVADAETDTGHGEPRLAEI